MTDETASLVVVSPFSDPWRSVVSPVVIYVTFDPQHLAIPLDMSKLK
jgi:hypothetical protein